MGGRWNGTEIRPWSINLNMAVDGQPQRARDQEQLPFGTLTALLGQNTSKKDKEANHIEHKMIIL